MVHMVGLSNLSGQCCRSVHLTRASIAVAAPAASNWRIPMRRRQALAGALPTELMVLVEISFIPFVSAGSLRLPSKTADHFAVSPLQNETAALGFILIRGNEVQMIPIPCTLKTEQRGQARHAL